MEDNDTHLTMKGHKFSLFSTNYEATLLYLGGYRDEQRWQMEIPLSVEEGSQWTNNELLPSWEGGGSCIAPATSCQVSWPIFKEAGKLELQVNAT